MQKSTEEAEREHAAQAETLKMNVDVIKMNFNSRL